MSNSEYTGLKELLLKQIIQQYIMNQYPWGIITRPLTPMALVILSIAYAVTVAMLMLSMMQIAMLIKYGIVNLMYMRAHGNRVNERGKVNTVPAHKLPFVSILIPIKNENIMTIERSLQTIASLNYPRELFEVLYISDDPEYYVNSLTKIIIPMSRRLGINVKVIRRTVNKGYKGGALITVLSMPRAM
ncbi:glycosyltransferase [Vulcanisaeta sp. JCM 16159]|uniref:glycosyltransferase n=1 Tax=Vulcanisaeta sp. JCM 16159 TaxID=1295371 RepID=UPI000A511344|nr:glycosyltransferase [Vulcanisaeta sp. JCM 16159]